MKASTPSISEPREIFRLLKTYWRRWLVPALALTAVAVAYAVVAPETWQASQTLMIRNDASNNDMGPGKFRIEDLKNVQETIMELARSRGVLTAALKEVGPPADCDHKETWPTPRDVEELQSATKILPPKGVEFGTAEVFYLEVRAKDQVRSVLLNRAICDHLQARFQEIRDAKAQSMMSELDKTVCLAKADLAEVTGRVTAIEKRVGSDLAELRVLYDSTAGDSSLRRTVTEIENELRQTRATEKAHRQMLDLLRSAKSDPGRLVAAPNRLLDSQPGLKRLKDGLVDAQIQTARLQGHMAAIHPLVLASKDTEDQIGQHLHDELAIAVRGLEIEVKLDTDHLAMLQTQLSQTTERLGKLAELRASYANLVAENGHRSKLVERAEQNLADARAAQASAKAASLISRIDTPDTGIRPVSPSRATIVLVGLLAGLVTGFGLVMLTAPAGRPSVAAAVHASQVEESPAIEPPAIEPPALPTYVSMSQILPPPLPTAAPLSLKSALEKTYGGLSGLRAR